MLCQLTAVEAVEQIRSGRISSVDLVTACLERISETDDAIGAWAYLNRDQALTQAQAMDEMRRTGKPLGALHGVPIGIKDIFDTSDMPTERGTPIHKNRQPDTDAAVISKLHEAGAVIMGKTVTTEFAFMHPAATRNPHNGDHTPGGSSSGSAAAVAAGHVPLAIGTQTNGSVIRPASFCGVYGFKPTRGMISRYGALQTSHNLDQVGVFGRSLEDVALLTDVLGGYDRMDPASYARPRPHVLEGSRQDPPVTPRFAWFDLPFNDRLDEATRDGLTEIITSLGGQIDSFPAPQSFSKLVECHQVIHEYEICRHLKDQLDDHWELVSTSLKPIIERARGHSDDRYDEACAMLESAGNYFADIFNDVDAILAPSASGEAPKLTSGTGDPVFCTIWTFCGLPCLTLPLLSGETGLPVGVQLIGSSEGDDRLLKCANWMQKHLTQVTDAGAEARPGEGRQ